MKFSIKDFFSDQIRSFLGKLSRGGFSLQKSLDVDYLIEFKH